MKVALYGKRMEILLKNKEMLEESFAATKGLIEIDCFSDWNSIGDNVLCYDIIVLSEVIMKEMSNYANEQKQQTLTLSVGKRIETFNIEKILYIEAELKNVHIWTKDEDVVINLPISGLEKLLDNKHFVKTHRSYIVNRKQIKSLSDKEVILKNGKKIPVSKYRYKEVREWYLRGI